MAMQTVVRASSDTGKDTLHIELAIMYLVGLSIYGLLLKTHVCTFALEHLGLIVFAGVVVVMDVVAHLPERTKR